MTKDVMKATSTKRSSRLHVPGYVRMPPSPPPEDLAYIKEPEPTITDLVIAAEARRSAVHLSLADDGKLMPVSEQGGLPPGWAAGRARHDEKDDRMESLFDSKATEQVTEVRPTTEHTGSGAGFHTAPSRVRDNLQHGSRPSFLGHISILIGAVVVLVAFIVILKVSEIPSPKRMIANATEWCSTSKSCLSAETFLQRAVNRTFRPCEDFYKHVCSMWIKPEKLLDGYLDQHTHALWLKILDRLESVRDNPMDRTLPQALALFYRSCYKFVTETRDLRRVVDQVTEALEMNSSHWVASKSLADLFPELSRMSLIMGIPSVVEIYHIIGAETSVYVTVGRTVTGIYEHPFDDTLEQYTKDVMSIISDSQVDRQVDIASIDGKFTKMHAEGRDGDFHPMPTTQLLTALSSEVWVSSIRSSLRSSNVLSQNMIYVRGLEVLRSAIKELVNMTRSQRNMYLLLIVLSNILTQDFKARYLYRRTEERTECLRATSKYFRPVFYQYIIDRFQHPKTESVIAAMEANIRRLLSDRIAASQWIAASRRRQIVRAMSRVKLWVGEFQKEVPHLPVYYYLTKGFVKNAALLLKSKTELRARSPNDPQLPLSQWEFTGHVGYVPEYRMIVVTAAILGPDAFYVHSASRLNYATVGALLAEALVEAGMIMDTNYPSGEEKKAEALTCYKHQVGAMLQRNGTASSAEIKELVASMLAFKVTYDINRYGVHATKERDQSFFRRFCMVGCGSSSARKRLLPGPARCNFLQELPEFSDAFGCPARPNVTSCLNP
ncbi:uncharacterized protein LOC135400866 [Ornithodoros turicata]|uniref:uncharacterized protein LOC135400866 n=1 Tax=Ornithodoros turicata TaxID=34597 RepID=UPI003138E2C5